MPDHVHGIIILDSPIKPGDGADVKPARTETEARPALKGVRFEKCLHGPMFTQKLPTIGDIVCAFKSLCVMDWLKYIKANNINAKGKFWQRNYYESIIRDERHLNNVRTYIRNNPLKWEMDQIHNSRRC